MARIIADVGGYLRARKGPKLDELSKQPVRNRTMEQLGVVINAADKIATSPAIVGGVAALRESFAGAAEDPRARAAKQLQDPQRVAKTLAATYGDASQVPTEIIANLPQETQDALVELYAQTAGPPETLSPGPSPLLDPVTAPRQAAAMEAARRKEAIAPAQPPMDIQRFVAGKEMATRADIAAEKARKQQQVRNLQTLKKEIQDAGLAQQFSGYFDADPAVRSANVAVLEELISGKDVVQQAAGANRMFAAAATPAQKAARAQQLLDFIDRYESIMDLPRSSQQGKRDVRAAEVLTEDVIRAQDTAPRAVETDVVGRAPVEQPMGFGAALTPGDSAGLSPRQDAGLSVDELTRIGQRALSGARAEIPGVPTSVPATTPQTEPSVIEPSVTAPVATAPAPAVTEGPREMVEARIATLEAMPRRSAYENYELGLLKAQRVGPTQAAVDIDETVVDTRTGAATRATPDVVEDLAEISVFDLSTPEGIYAAARTADSRMKQAVVLEAAAKVLRPERKRPQTIYDALGFGGPTQPTQTQLRTVTALFPQMERQSDKDIARARLYEARALETREKAKLVSEKAETERIQRGAKTETELSKGFKNRASALAALERAKAAMLKARKTGRGRATNSLKKAAKDAKAANKMLRSNAESRKKELESEERQMARVKPPGVRPERPEGYTDAALANTAAGRRYLKSLDRYKKDMRAYEAAQERLKKIPAEKEDLDAVVQETFVNDERILEDAREGLQAVKKSLRKGTSKRKSTTTTSSKPNNRPKKDVTAEDFLD